MKILILQLARLGDIYLTWPTLRALKRTRPDVELHVLCRPRFADAFIGIEEVDHVHCLPTREILSPLLEDSVQVETSMDILATFIEEMRTQGFEKICNLTYSPLSSYLTAELAAETTEVLGYTRFSDGFLAVPDDTSAYFSAQVGLGRANRIHLADLFAMTLDLDLVEDDWRAPVGISLANRGRGQVAIHMGASQREKMYPVAHWKSLVSSLLSQEAYNLVLIGSYDERELSEFIMKAFAGHPKLRSEVGSASLQESLQIIADSDLLIGGDSAPIHMASLVQTPTLNISAESVNFWETGPRANGSAVLCGNSKRTVDPDEICDLALSMLQGVINLELVNSACEKAVSVKGIPSFKLSRQAEDLSWELAKAIYLGQMFPEIRDETALEGMRQLFEANDIVLKQIESMMKTGRNESSLSILASGEEVIEAIGQIVPQLQVVVHWYQTEKLRLGPDSFEEVLSKTGVIHRNLEQILMLYLMDEVPQDQELDEVNQEGQVRDEADTL